jgi:hypothetical protein
LFKSAKDKEFELESQLLAALPPPPGPSLAKEGERYVLKMNALIQYLAKAYVFDNASFQAQKAPLPG